MKQLLVDKLAELNREYLGLVFNVGLDKNLVIASKIALTHKRELIIDLYKELEEAEGMTMEDEERQAA